MCFTKPKQMLCLSEKLALQIMEKASWVVNKYNAIEIIPKLKVQNVVVLEPANALG